MKTKSIAKETKGKIIKDYYEMLDKGLGGNQKKSNERMEKYINFVKPTYIENWTVELYNLSIAQVDIPVTPDVIKCILDEKVPVQLMPEIQKAIDMFPRGVFIRLGSRSPKDSWTGYKKGLKVMDGKTAVSMLASSERVFDDLFLAQSTNYKPHIFVRKWIDIPEWTEFRCFMRDRKLIGITQYHCLDNQVFDEIIQNKDSIQWAICKFFNSSFKNASHLDTVVFDVFLKTRQEGNEFQWEVKLLEINPFFEDTFPGLFKWENGGDFDGSFRCNKKGGDNGK